MKIVNLQTGIVALPNDEPLAGFSENPNAKNRSATSPGRRGPRRNDTLAVLTTTAIMATRPMTAKQTNYGARR